MFGNFIFSEQPFISDVESNSGVPSILDEANSRLAPRIRVLKDLHVNDKGDFVVYWMTATRRYKYNAALERAIEIALAINKKMKEESCEKMR